MHLLVKRIGSLPYEKYMVISPAAAPEVSADRKRPSRRSNKQNGAYDHVGGRSWCTARAGVLFSVIGLVSIILPPTLISTSSAWTKYIAWRGWSIHRFPLCACGHGISPDQFSFAESVVFLTMALLGGVRSPFGAALGTALLILLPEWLRFLKDTYLAVYGGAVILLMVFMPEGIWGFLEALRQRLWPPAVTPVGRVAPLSLTTQIADEDDSTILEVKQLSKHFGGLKAVDEVELSVHRGTCRPCRSFV
jgi:hypothetical protein